MAKTALALSAGGMFGSYQAGVWEVLADFFQPDIVVGASVGSLNGWLVASGASPSTLTGRWRNLDSIQHLQWRVPKRFSDGVLEATVLDTWIQEMCHSCRPACEFGVVLTRVSGLKPTLFRWPGIGWEHIAGSCAVPGFLRHYRFGGEIYTDGGLLEPSPVWAARAMRAGIVVSVNVMRDRPLPIRAVVRVAKTCSRYHAPSMANTKVINIDPTRRLGTARDSMYWSRSNADRWIEAGRHDALRQKHFLVECLQQP